MKKIHIPIQAGIGILNNGESVLNNDDYGFKRSDLPESLKPDLLQQEKIKTLFCSNPFRKLHHDT